MATWKKILTSGSAIVVDTIKNPSSTISGTQLTGSFTGSFTGDGSNLTGVAQNIDDLSTLGGASLHQTQDHFLVSDNGTEKKVTFSNLEDSIFANISGDATIAAGGAVTIAANAVENSMIAVGTIASASIAADAIDANHLADDSVKAAALNSDVAGSGLEQHSDGTIRIAAAAAGAGLSGGAGSALAVDFSELTSATPTFASLTLSGDLTVNGTTTTIATTNTKVEDQLMFLGTGSAGTNKDVGIVAQSGSTDLQGSAFYNDTTSERWSVAKSVNHNATAITPLQFVTTVKTDTVNPSSDSGSYGAGEMHVNTSTGDIWIRFG